MSEKISTNNEEAPASSFESLTDAPKFDPEAAKRARAEHVIEKKQEEISAIDEELAKIDALEDKAKRPSTIYHTEKNRTILDEKRIRSQHAIDRANAFIEKHGGNNPASDTLDMSDMPSPESNPDPESNPEPESEPDMPLSEQELESDRTTNSAETKGSELPKTVGEYRKMFEKLPNNELAQAYLDCLGDLSDNFTSHTTIDGHPRASSSPNHYSDEDHLVNTLIKTATGKTESEISKEYGNDHAMYRKKGTADELIDLETSWRDTGAECDKIAKQYGAESVNDLLKQYQAGDIYELTKKLTSMGQSVMQKASKKEEAKRGFNLFRKKQDREMSPDEQQELDDAKSSLHLALELSDAFNRGQSAAREMTRTLDEAYGAGGIPGETISDEDNEKHNVEFSGGNRGDLVNKAIALRKILNTKGLINRRQ